MVPIPPVAGILNDGVVDVVGNPLPAVALQYPDVGTAYPAGSVPVVGTRERRTFTV